LVEITVWRRACGVSFFGRQAFLVVRLVGVVLVFPPRTASPTMVVGESGE
jgi:hypothetical protein